jgi:hypothetical protein
MQKVVWLALFCAVGVGGLFVIRSPLGVSASSRGVPEVTAADVVDVATPLPKGDRLPSRFFDNPLPQPAVETVKIVPAEPSKQEPPKQETPKRSEAARDDVVSWHWHEGSKVIRRRRAQ